jgi:cytochrome b6-f complex iron-sulfur subunit
MDRKDFLKKTLALCGVAMIPVGVMESCSKTSYSGPSNVNFTVDLTNTSNASLNVVGGSLLVNGLILTRPASGGFEAFSATCTHQGCTVGYQSSNNTLVCPCHGGVYSGSTGAVVSGPPPSALTKYNVTQSGNTLTIKSA